MDRRAWWATVHRVAQSWTRLKQLSTHAQTIIYRMDNSKRSKQSILKEISPEYSLEGLMLKLKLSYSGHLICRPDSLEKTLMLGKTEGRRRRGRQRMRLVGWHHRHNGLWQLVIDRRPGVLRFMGLQRVGHN